MFLYLYSIKKRYEMAGKKKTYRIKRLSEKEFKNSFGTEEQCIEAFEKLRWGENIQSPFTGSYNVARRKKPGTYRDRYNRTKFLNKDGHIHGEIKSSIIFVVQSSILLLY